MCVFTDELNECFGCDIYAIKYIYTHKIYMFLYYIIKKEEDRLTL